MARKLVSTSGSTPEDSALLADTLRKAGQHAEAARMYQRALSQSNSNDPRGQWFIEWAQSLVAQGDLYGASHALAAAVGSGASDSALTQGRAALGLALAQGIPVALQPTTQAP